MKTFLFFLQDGQCHYDPNYNSVNATGFVDIPSGKENALMEAVAAVGPVSVAIDAGHETFKFYQSGQFLVLCNRDKSKKHFLAFICQLFLRWFICNLFWWVLL